MVASSAQIETRQFWVGTLMQVAGPVLPALAQGRLQELMPVAQRAGARRELYSPLEAFARLMSGLSSWFDAQGLSAEEERQQSRCLARALEALERAVDFAQPGALHFGPSQSSYASQPLVDAAFLGLAVLRSQRLQNQIAGKTKAGLIKALQQTRLIEPCLNNWVLFSAMVEAALYKLGADCRRDRVEFALDSAASWYKGDGVFGDGPSFAWDYYNSFVMHPMLLVLLETFGAEKAGGSRFLAQAKERAQRYASHLERMVAPDGSFPCIGRSMAYRCGALHALADLAARNELPSGLSAPMARAALSRAIFKTLKAPQTFDSQGWLAIGLCGSQPDLGESYISTGSLYLCATAFLPLRLGPQEPFWALPAEMSTWEKAWGGCNLPADKALKG